MRSFLGVLFALMLYISCSVEDRERAALEVGQEFTDSDVRVITIDTFTVELSTFKFDSINSSSSGRLLVGRYIDSLFGTVSSQPYFELSTTNYSLPDDAELDSIALILGYDRYFYNDTIRLSQINVHQILEDLEPEEGFFYNTSTLKFDSIPVTSRNYFPEPVDEDSLHISIPTAFGQEIFDLIQENEINEDDELRELFKGFTLVPGKNEDASIIGFSRNMENSYLRFFYSIPEEFDEEEGTFDLFINQNIGVPRAFNNIESDVSETVLSQLTDQEINLKSTESDNVSYIQSGIGFATRIVFPTIRGIGEIPGNGTVLSAVLQLTPPQNSFDDMLPIRDSLNVTIVDRNNVITETLANGNGDVFAVTNQNDIEFNEIFYEIQLGIYVDRKLAESPIIQDALVLFPNNFNDSVNRILINGENTEDSEAKLIITYAIYED
ncbi:hypothetical protein MTsPCn5_24600 [Croceitalea sp. MTPC5]|uniref:DUF4270 family protein n=1 Tax=Croceitalea sp. MTPC5 TaxID=3056565 RepID=UPI002B3DF01F|nr:hypothetical protein MTsPCn5_24600 [Croceitalea sp. MTPC5]